MSASGVVLVSPLPRVVAGDAVVGTIAPSGAGAAAPAGFWEASGACNCEPAGAVVVCIEVAGAPWATASSDDAFLVATCFAVPEFGTDLGAEFVGPPGELGEGSAAMAVAKVFAVITEADSEGADASSAAVTAAGRSAAGLATTGTAGDTLGRGAAGLSGWSSAEVGKVAP